MKSQQAESCKNQHVCYLNPYESMLWGAEAGVKVLSWPSRQPLRQMKMLTGQDMEASQAELDQIAKDLDPVAHQLAGAIAANDGDCKVQ